MSGVNKVILLARLGKDPELKTFQNGGKIANFSVATSEEWKDKQTGEKKSQTEWHNVVAQNALADIVMNYLHKGDQVYIEGKLKTRSWEKDGVTRYVTEVICQTLQMLGSKGQSSGDQQQERSAASPVTQTPQQAAYNDLDLPF